MDEFERNLIAEIPMLRRMAVNWTRDHDRAADLVQDTLVLALSKRHLFEPGTNLKGWLGAIMHNKRVNGVRASVCRPETSYGDMADAIDGVVCMNEPQMAAMRFRDLQCGLGQLSSEQRDIVLFMAEGNKYEAAAEFYHLPIGTVRSRLSRGREALRGYMEGARVMETADPGRSSRAAASLRVLIAGDAA